ncbi:probable glycosyltransferase At5g20260 [Sesamum indicum]|uniref:Probable glycosyltransferase At5g20260 n=1 Tax=Sesamum indicum TaxID=4182 RepID=A0A6I9TP95_SESIN|nr:probable glycosyltransferase At5g20260 [Sesamum indicum]
MVNILRVLRSLRLRRIFIGLLTISPAATIILFSITRFMYQQFDRIIASVEVDKIDGDVYRSAEVFRMDYAEMERKFKIYVYPDEYKDENYTNYQTISGKYASEGYFFKNIRESSFLTDDPEQAHLFFIPISCHKMHQKVSSYEEMASIVQKYVEGLIAKYPYWTRTMGADHFFVTCHDVDVRVTELVPHLVKNSIRVVCSPTYDSGFIPHKDVSLPLVMQPLKEPVRRNDLYKRTILGYWEGACNSDLRNTLVSNWQGDNELDIQNSTYYPAGGMRKLSMAKFCICPVGSRATSNRIIMAIRYGCVPVILADYFELPFNDVLDWLKFSVVLSEEDVYDLKYILRGKAGEEYSRLHSNLIKVQKRFRWNSPPVKYDAFHMVLYHLWLRRNVVKY